MRPASRRLRLPTHLRAVALCSRKSAAYSCRAVAAFHRASRASRQRTAFAHPLRFRNHQLLSVGRPTPVNYHRGEEQCTSNEEERPAGRVLAVPNQTGEQIQRPIQQTKRRFGLIPESLSTFPSRPIRIDVNSAGLLARASLDGSCLPSAIAPVAYLLPSSALTVAGPLRICTGFPYKTES